MAAALRGNSLSMKKVTCDVVKEQITPWGPVLENRRIVTLDVIRGVALFGKPKGDLYMTKEPQTWHYGLVAKWWAEFRDEGPEIAYYQECIKRYGQPALDVACGTGRLLLPYLRAGLDVDGCDISPDMLALCREKAAREGLSPRLYQQAMHELDLPWTYKTIFVCGSFGIGGDRRQDFEALDDVGAGRL